MSALFNLVSCSALDGMFLTPFESAPIAALLGYVGPGAGLSMMGSLLAVVLVILLALLGPLLYPIRLVHSAIRRRRERNATHDVGQQIHSVGHK